jgi:hypothetical protein
MGSIDGIAWVRDTAVDGVDEADSAVEFSQKQCTGTEVRLPPLKSAWILLRLSLENSISGFVISASGGSQQWPFCLRADQFTIFSAADS